MRRFIESKAGRALSHIVAAALILPSVTFGFVRRADAQLQQNPAIAVVDFRDLKVSGSQYGQRAAEALSGAFGATQTYDVVPRETIQREVETLGLRQPLPTLTNVFRVGQQLRLTRPGDTIATGEIVDYRVLSSPQGRQAQVSMRVVMYDVPSQIAVNGAGISTSSTVRSGDVSDETLINDAISSAANTAVNTIRSQTLPTATIQNTFQRSAIINQGTRSGFKNGQDVIVSRGREQVATARISDTQPGSATINVVRSFKGLQPGDRVRAVFSPPDIVPGFGANGEAKVTRPKRNNNLAPLITILLVLGVIVLLTSGGNGGRNDAALSLEAQPSFNPGDTTPSVQLNWKGNAFSNNNSQSLLWQIYRDDVATTPVLIVPGTQRSAIDGPTTGRAFQFVSGLQASANFECTVTALPRIAGTSTAPISGRPYRYAIELVFQLQRQDTFSGNTSQTTGTNTTTNTGTTTTGGTNTTNTTVTTTTTTGTTGIITGADPCFFVSGRTQSTGQATPLARPQLVSPANDAVVSTAVPFTFVSPANSAFPVALGYVLQLSTSPVFVQNRTTTLPEFIFSNAGTLSAGTIDTSASSLPAFIRNATVLYYRIGVRNVADSPGPVRDPATRLRYVFSAPNRITRPSSPPPPPSE